MDKCPEPNGNERPYGKETAHTIMIKETGQCPWCGKGN